MKKIFKVILIITGILVVALTALYFLVMKGIVPVNVIPGARTLYEGYVEIETISLSEIKAKLEEQGCHINDYKGEATSRCRYQETVVPFDKKNGVVIYPNGFGWGPISFYVTENKLWDTKDIPGSPNLDKFKEEVRRDVDAIGDIVRIKENSWKITETKYPWTAIY